MDRPKSQVLVTGGAGFIGAHLVHHLLQTPRLVRVLERPGATVTHLPLGKFELIRADIRDRRAVRAAVSGCEEVYHLAANPQLWTHRRGHFHQVNYLGTVNVLEEAVAAGARRILHTSTESILTRRRDDAPIRESQQVRLEDQLGPYCRSKFRAEQHALRLARQGAPVVIVNPTLPVGPGDFGRSPPTQMLLDFCSGGRRQYVEAELNLIDVRDVAEGMVRAMERGVPGRRYLLGHENLSIRVLFGRLAMMTGLPPADRRVPLGLALAVAYVSEFVADVWTGEPPLATVTGVRLAARSMRFDASESLAALGLQPRPLDVSLTDAVRWFVEIGWLDAAQMPRPTARPE